MSHAVPLHVDAPVRASVDVAVVGSGPSGLSAAISAARRGARGDGREAGMMTRGSERVVLLCCLVVSIAIGTVALLMLAHASTL